MAANPKKGIYGHLKQPRKRLRQLRALAGYSLEEAGLHLGVGKERVRHLSFLYGVKRKRRARQPNEVWIRGGNYCLRRITLKNHRLPTGSCRAVLARGKHIRVWTITMVGSVQLFRDCYFPAVVDAKRAINLLGQPGSLDVLYRKTNPV